MDEIQRTTLDFVAWIVERRGDVPFLDADDQAEVRAALDSDAPGRERLSRIVAVIDAKVDKKDVSRWARERENA